jgi:hypothetical protein
MRFDVRTLAIALLAISAAACSGAATDAMDPESSDADLAADVKAYGPESPTPILISVGNKKYDLTNAAGGVMFDIDANGTKEQVSWTTAASDDAFLFLDRNGNNTVDNGAELFGDATPQPAATVKNGFLALAEYDKVANGGNADRRITSADAVFNSLRLWQDVNHNGISEPDELKTLTALDVTGIDLKYHVERKKDKYGNQFRYRAKVSSVKKSTVAKEAYDVILVVQP